MKYYCKMQLPGLFDIPDWYSEYKEFSETLKQRNHWFIHVRYVSAWFLLIASLFLFIFPSVIPNFQFRLFYLTIPALLIAVNTVLHRMIHRQEHAWDYRSGLSFAFLQVVLDIIVIALLIYITGGVESVFSFLFVFHVIISALLFPARLVVLIAGGIVLFYNSVAWLEFFGIIQHISFGMAPMLGAYNNWGFTVISTLVFTAIIIVSSLIAHRIADDMVRQQNALFEAFKKLEIAEKEKQQYVIAIVHEIKQPVTVVTSFLEMIHQKYLGDVPDAIADVVQKCITRNREAVEMINGIIKISKLRLMNQIQMETLDFGDLIEGIIARYQPLLEKKKIALDRNLSECRNVILGDPFLINLALSNVMSNAIKYNTTSGRILISLYETPDSINVEFSDSGLGLSHDDMQKVSRDFFRAATITNKNIEGAGVGLALIKQIIEKHNGTMSFLSPSEIGTKEHPGTKVTLKFTYSNNI